MWIGVVVVLVIIFGGVAAWLRNAPEGYEDEHQTFGKYRNCLVIKT